MNIIADIAGRYEELMLLLDKMPKGERIVLLGDLNDRGPDSNKVIQWAIDNNIECVKSNHGDMLIAAKTFYDKNEPMNLGIQIFLQNGGHQTLTSYGGFDNIPESHIEYLKNCPWYVETDDLILTHAPLIEKPSEQTKFDAEFFWNRKDPQRLDKFQIFGHNAWFEEFKDENGPYAICLDNSFNKELTGIHWPSRTIYRQEYL